MSEPAAGPAVLVVCSPAAASFDGPALEAALAAAFEARGETWRRFDLDGETGGPVALAHALRDAVTAGCPLVVAAGGDGTVSAIADALATLDRAARPLVAILPLGTANVLAREFEIPMDLAPAVALAAARVRVADVDAIRVGTRCYLTQLGAGLDAKMIEGTSREDQQSKGRWAYMQSLVGEMTGYRAHAFDLTIDGRRYRKRAWQVVVANAKTMGTPPFTWGPDIVPTDGVLNVGVYDVRGALDWIRLALRFLTGRHQPDRRARYFEVRRGLRIATRFPVAVQADGDVIGDTPVDVAVEPALLRLVVGPPEAAESTAAQAAPPATGPALEAPPGPVAAVAADAAQAVRLTLWTRVSGLDHAAYLWVNRFHAWPPATWVARAVSRTMDHGELWALVALFVAVADPAHDWVAMLALVAVVWAVELTVNFPIKAAFRRRRPFDAHAHADVRVLRLPRDWSFPSGHSATAFAGALLLSMLVPVVAPLFFLYAGIVAVSRVYLGVHYPVDVVLGGAVGMGLAVLYGAGAHLLLGMR